MCKAADSESYSVKPQQLTSYGQISPSMSYRTFTYVERGVARPGKIIYVGNPKGLDGHRAHTEEQLSAGHEQPQLVGVGETPAVVSATRLRRARVQMQVANVVTIWNSAGGQRGRCREGEKEKTAVISDELVNASV